MPGQINVNQLEKNWNDLAGHDHAYHRWIIAPKHTGNSLFFSFECTSPDGISGSGHVNFKPEASKDPWFSAHVSLLKGKLTNNVKIAFWFEVEKVGPNGDVRNIKKVPGKITDTNKNFSSLPDGLFNAMKAFLEAVYRGTL